MKKVTLTLIKKFEETSSVTLKKHQTLLAINGFVRLEKVIEKYGQNVSPMKRSIIKDPVTSSLKIAWRL